MIEACVNCQKSQDDAKKEEIMEEIKAFLKEPNKFYVRYNPKTRFYKFERFNEGVKD